MIARRFDDSVASVRNVKIEPPPSTLQWSGRTWDIASGFGGPGGEGGNYWSPDRENVWVDDNGWLHLRITRRGTIWYCASVSSQEYLGYGDYVFYTNSRVDALPSNVTAGLFNYSDNYNGDRNDATPCSQDGGDCDEIDIEFGEIVEGSNNAQYVIQPAPYVADLNIHRFPLALQGDYSTHRIQWRTTEVVFDSYHGHTLAAC